MLTMRRTVVTVIVSAIRGEMSSGSARSPSVATVDGSHHREKITLGGTRCRSKDDLRISAAASELGRTQGRGFGSCQRDFSVEREVAIGDGSGGEESVE